MGGGKVMTTQTVSTSGSGLVFHNTYTANCSQQYINCIVAAEQQFERLWTNSVTINITFDEVAQGNTGDLLPGIPSS
jgi:nitrogen fixation protein FixH